MEMLVKRIRDVPRGTNHRDVTLYGRDVWCPGCHRETLQRIVRVTWRPIEDVERNEGGWQREFVCLRCGHEWDEWDEWGWLIRPTEVVTTSGAIEVVTTSRPTEVVTTSGAIEVVTMSGPTEVVTTSGAVEAGPSNGRFARGARVRLVLA